MPDGLAYAGLNLAGPALTARDLSGLLSLPERRGENVPVPGRHGTVRAQRKRYGGLVAPFEILVRGYRLDGTANVEDPAGQVAANLDVLGRVLALDAGLLVHTLPDESTRSVVAEARAAVDATRDRSGMLATVKVAFESASAFWRADEDTVATVTLPSGGSAQLGEFDGCTAPIDDAVVTFGPGANPRLDAGDGFIAYDATIPSGATVTIDCGAYDVRTTGALTRDRTKLRTTPGAGTWLELAAEVGGPTVQLTHAGGSPMNITVAARKAWVFG
jgi:hypothetical protein